jgi:lathosterol oxidase
MDPVESIRWRFGDAMSLMPEHPFLYPALFAALLYGLRFWVFALVAFFLFDPSRRRRLGRAHPARPANFAVAPNIARELGHSLVMVGMIGVVNGLLFGYGLLSSSQLYFRITDHPTWWFWASIPAMLVLHDTLFYWLHRAMHTKLLFARMHLLHHRSIYPTAFAAYSFSWSEALAEALIVTAIIYIIPVHPLALLIFQTISTAYNVYGHCGAELYPAKTGEHWLGRCLNTSSLHEHHHRSGRGNYSFYFTFWDRLMGTLEPGMSQVHRRPTTPSRASA